MILTCPACQTKYVVKDGAIPPGGRQVRCASCKNSWHQDPVEGAELAAPGAAEDAAVAAAAIVEQPAFPTAESPPAFDPVESQAPPAPAPPPLTEDRQWQQVEPASAWDEPVVAADPDTGAPSSPEPEPVADDFEPFYDHEPLDQPKRKWPLFLILILLVALAAVAFWFLAPAELRARAGLGPAGRSQLHVVVNANNYQQLASGNNLFTVSGRIVNSTDARQPVPPIRAELLDSTRQKVIYSWTISPPAASLDLNKSASFNSAEVGVPEGGKYIRLRLGGPA